MNVLSEQSNHKIDNQNPNKAGHKIDFLVFFPNPFQPIYLMLSNERLGIDGPTPNHISRRILFTLLTTR